MGCGGIILLNGFFGTVLATAGRNSKLTVGLCLSSSVASSKPMLFLLPLAALVLPEVADRYEQQKERKKERMSRANRLTFGIHLFEPYRL